MCFHTIDGRKWTYFLLCCRNSDTQTFNGEDELAGVLASIGGHPALPQSSLLSTQTRDLKQCCTLIWVHDSARGLRIQHITHNRNAGLKKKHKTHIPISCAYFFSHLDLCSELWDISWFLWEVLVQFFIRLFLLSRKQHRKKNTETEHFAYRQHVVAAAPQSDITLSVQAIVCWTSSEPDSTFNPALKAQHKTNLIL